jgi:hypothetical protein
MCKTGTSIGRDYLKLIVAENTNTTCVVTETDANNETGRGNGRTDKDQKGEHENL